VTCYTWTIPIESIGATGTINFEVEMNDLLVVFAELDRKLQAIEPLLALYGKEIRSVYEKNFLAGGRPDRWQPLSAETIRRKTRMGLPATQNGKPVNPRLMQNVPPGQVYGPGVILIRSGDLHKSYTEEGGLHVKIQATDGLAGGSIEEGSKVKYAHAHQYGREEKGSDGKSTGKVLLPMRAQNVTDEDEQRFVMITKKHLGWEDSSQI